MAIAIIEAVDTLQDRYVPRFEVFVAKAGSTPRSTPSGGAPPILDPTAALAAEKARLDASIFKTSGAPGAPPPTRSQLLPLAGPWGDKSGQRTDDILSVTFTEDVNQNLTTVELEVLNVYDSVRKYYRYTDIPPHLSEAQKGAFPLLDYGDTIALRFGYGADLDWVFDGMITNMTVSFPEGGESRVHVTATDRRDRLRNRKVVNVSSFKDMSEAQIVAKIASEVGLGAAAPGDLLAFSGASASGGLSFNVSVGTAAAAVSASVSASAPGVSVSASFGISTSAQSAASQPQNQVPATSGTPEGAPGNNFKATDQDALQYITDRLTKAALELSCFGNTLFVLRPADAATSALRYVYRQGLSSFTPAFNGAGIATRVRVTGRNSHFGTKPEAEVGAEDLRKEGLITQGEVSILEKIASAGQAGDRVEAVTNYPAATDAQARRIAIGMLKRNLDAAFTASGSVIGDPRIRGRTTLKVEGVGRFDGFYYVTVATHRLGPNGYQTDFTLRRNTALPESGAGSSPTLREIGTALLERTIQIR